MRAANLLVGNQPSAAALEITLVGPRIRFLAATVIGLAGADIQARLDDQPVQPWRPCAAPEGSLLTFGNPRDGLRAYLAVAGGIDVPMVLGSRSTFTRGALGGFNGRSIQRGDRIGVAATQTERIDGRAFPTEEIPSYGHEHVVRVVLGPQADAFTAEGIATFLSADYVVTPKSDRIGCRLAGPPVAHATSPDIVSDGNPCGAVQIAGDGRPMVLVADRGTTGGYTKLATVISADLPQLAQAVSGDRVSFRDVSLAEAHRALRLQEAVLQRVARSAPVVFTRKRFDVTLDNASYTVSVGLVEQGRMAPVERLRGTADIASEGQLSTMQYEISDAGGHR
jgi:biotin-dependent carboxylase-like uncharacterized protein